MIKYTEKEKEIAIEFAKDLVDCGLITYIAHSMYDEREKFYHNLDSLPYDTLIASGSTRGVFGRDDGELDNWVLKVNFDSNSQDYCKMEADFYQEAVKNEVDFAFAATYYLTTINNIDFYIQERLDCNCAAQTSEMLREYIINDLGFTKDEDEDEDEYNERLWEYKDDGIDWYDVLDCLIGDSEVAEFVDQREINDLHEANYGLTKDGYFKLVDYCGYYE